MKKNLILTIAKKEFFNFINSPIAYTVTVPFLLLSIFIYIRTTFVGGEATLRPYFELLPWFLLLLAPAISMRLLTDEYKSQTIELLFAHPLTELEIILGKFFGALLFYGTILFTTIGLPLTILIYSRPDLGQIIGQYIGALFVGATFIAIGIAASAYVENAISSFLLAAALSFLLMIIGLNFVTGFLPAPFNFIATEVSVLTHGENIARGLLDIRDVFYFISVTGFLLIAAVFKLSERKITENRGEKRKMQLWLGLILVAGVAANIFLSFYPLRLDLTEAQLFTLSQGTKQTISKLPGPVNLTVYRSRELPAQMERVAREITDLLKDYSKLSRNVKVNIVYPQENSKAMNQAQEAGIQEVQFNSIAAGKFAVQAGLLGLTINYNNKTDSLPFISDTTNLEYQLTRRIRKITAKKSPVIGVLNVSPTDNKILPELISSQYDTKIITEGDEISVKDIAGLIYVDNGTVESTATAQLKSYLSAGGKALIMASGMAVSEQTLTAQKSLSSINTVIKDYGVKVNPDLVYDLELAETLGFNGQNGERYLAPYPYWFKSLPVENGFTPLSTLKSISVGWASSLTLEKKPVLTVKTILTTGTNSGRSKDTVNISPQSAGSLAVNAANIAIGAAVETKKNRLVVVGASSLADDQFLTNNRDNIALLSNTIDYLAADPDLGAIPSKSSGQPVFEFNSPADIYLVQYGNLLLPPLIVVIFAVYHLRKRKLRAGR